MSQYLIHNGELFPADQPIIRLSDRSFRYGDGVFETMKMENSVIKYSRYHFERLFNGLGLLGFQVPSWIQGSRFEEEMYLLARENHFGKNARIRLTVSRGSINGPELNQGIQYFIECTPLLKMDPAKELEIDVYPVARKSMDVFSNIKSNNFLPYIMASIYANQNKLNDCLVLNSEGRICDSTIANVFWVKDKNIFTPPLSEGCIAGIMRRVLLEKGNIKEMKMEISELESADEVFLTNAVQGVMKVGRFRDKKFKSELTEELRNEFLIK